MSTTANAQALDAIEPERNAIVHASAGTGKTWLLVSRIVRLLLAGAEPGRILAITFTRKAAAEMRLRLNQRLLAMCEADDAKLAGLLRDIGVDALAATRARARQLYEAQLIGPYELRATTFHAFCQELLQRFAFEAGVPPAFEVIEQTAELEQAAWRALDEDLRDNDSGLAAALDRLMRECRGPVNVQRALATFLAKRSDWWAYVEDAADPVGTACAHLRNALDVDPATDPADVFARDAEVRRLIAVVTNALHRHPGQLKTTLACLEAAAGAPNNSEFYSLLCRAFYTTEDEPRCFEVTKVLVKAIGATEAETLARAFDALLERVAAARERQRRYTTWRRSCDWYLLGNRLLEHFQRIKFEQGMLDFADLEWLTYGLLRRGRHAEWVQYKLDQRIDHLLIDEFQDTNPTQWRLILPLLTEMTAGANERARSAFLVGDEKQSIYRFRRADPGLMREARVWLENHAAAQGYEQYVSWRSSPAVVRFVNLAFEPAGDDSYALAGFHAHDTHRRNLWGRAELMALVARDPAAKPNAYFRNPLAEPRRLDDDMRHRREGDMVAAKIRSLLGAPVSHGDGVRPVRYGDVLILLRDRKYAAAYEAALRHAGIPYVGAGRGTFLECLEVRDLLNLLRLLIAPFDDVALASVLRSPVFAASDDDLLAVADAAGGTWWQRLETCARGTARADLARAVRLLQQWRALADRVPVHDLLDRIYFDAALPDRYRAASPAHLRERVAANLDRLLDLALELDSGRFPSLARFLDRLALFTQEDNESLGGAALEAGDQVRMLTIHGAKGLEAPVVFVVDAARDPAARDRGPAALIEWRIGEERPRHFLLAPPKGALDRLSAELLEHETDAAKREEANLLYVALTRAQQMLFVSGCEPRGENSAAKSGVGDSARGWYGHIERRIQAAVADGTAQSLGLQTTLLPMPNGDGVYNLFAHIDYGVAPATPLSGAAAEARTIPLDPRLTRPFANTGRSSAIVPSHASTADPYDDPHAGGAGGLLDSSTRRGVVIHRMLERLTSDPQRERARRLVRQEFGATLDADWLETCWTEACAVVDDAAFARFFNPAYYQEARNEVVVVYPDNGRTITGVIDRLLITKDRLVLLDYKTHRVPAEALASLAASYAAQLRAYAQALRGLWPGRPVEAVLLFTAVRSALTVDVTSGRERARGQTELPL